MKFYWSIIFICLYFWPRVSSAQTAIDIFSTDKKKFYLFVDGLKENETPKSRVRIKNLIEGPHHIKVIFEQREINNPQLKVNLERGKSYTYEIKLYSNKDRKWYGINESARVEWSEKQVKKIDNKIDSLSTDQIKKAETKADSILKANLPVQVISKPKDTVIEKKPKPPVKADFNCDKPLHPKGFNLIVHQVEDSSPENVRIDKAKSLIRTNCLSSIQIMELLQVFEFEVSKLELAAFAYNYCFDPVNYNFVEDVFEYDSSIQELHNKIYAQSK